MRRLAPFAALLVAACATTPQPAPTPVAARDAASPRARRPDRPDRRRACPALWPAQLPGPRRRRTEAPVCRARLRPRRLSLSAGERLGRRARHPCRHPAAIGRGRAASGLPRGTGRALDAASRSIAHSAASATTGSSIADMPLDRAAQRRIAAVARRDQAIADHPVHADALDRRAGEHLAEAGIVERRADRPAAARPFPRAAGRRGWPAAASAKRFHGHTARQSSQP